MTPYRSAVLLFCLAFVTAGCDEHSPQTSRAENAYAELSERANALPAMEVGMDREAYFSRVANSSELSTDERRVFAALAEQADRQPSLSAPSPRLGNTIGAALTAAVDAGALTDTDAATLSSFISDLQAKPLLARSLGKAYSITEEVESLSDTGLGAFTAIRVMSEGFSDGAWAQLAAAQGEWTVQPVQAAPGSRPNDIASRCAGVGIDPPPDWQSCHDLGDSFALAVGSALATGAIICQSSAGFCAAPGGSALLALGMVGAGALAGGGHMLMTYAAVEEATDNWCGDIANRRHEDWHETCARRTY